jgi:chemotaxis protein MotB
MRRRRKAGHSNHERWLVSYADFITLLFAFFVVLYATAQVDKKKVGQIAVAIHVAFDQLGAFQGGSAKVEGDDKAVPIRLVPIDKDEKLATPVMLKPASQPLSNVESADLEPLRRDLEKELSVQIEKKEITIRHEADGLVVSLSELGFFDSGSAEIKTDAQRTFARIAELLASRDCRLRIEGHTDNRPIHTLQFASNWELSTARATELVRILITTYNYLPERLSAAGYAEFHPVAANDTAEGRALNRRLDIVVLGKVTPAHVGTPIAFAGRH